MPPDQHLSPFSSLFTQLKHLRCREAVSGHVIDVGSEKHAGEIEYLNVDIDEEALEEPAFREVSHSFADPRTWRPVCIKSLGTGIVIVPGVLKQEACKEWFDRLLHEYPRRGTGFRSNVQLPLHQEQRFSKLRWLTFGYHYLWSSKIYDLNEPGKIPPELEMLFKALSRALRIGFEPEAGIINYYTCKSRLSPHADVSEQNLNAPLFSLSFGGSAIFMVGGERKEDSPVIPIRLSDGDLLIMRAEKRLSFHAVPKIYCPPDQKECSGIVRININARQVFRTEQ